VTTTENTSNGTTDSSADVDWDALLSEATTEDVKRPTVKPTWDGPIPAGLRKLVDQANDQVGKRVVIPLKGENAQNVYDQTRAMVTHIADEYPPKDGSPRTANVRPQHDKDGKLTAITFTITSKRGRKPKAVADSGVTDSAPATGNDAPAVSESTTVSTVTDAAPLVPPIPAPDQAAKSADKPADQAAAKTTPRRGGK
jgi:hypothetical protein